MMSNPSPKIPKYPVFSEFQWFGWALGEPISVLPKKRPTSEISLDFGKSQKSKIEVINQVVETLITHWMVQGFEVEIRTKKQMTYHKTVRTVE